jgi:GNAT superfamily N-acetyltransferase
VFYTTYRERVVFVYQSTGILGLLRGFLRKCVSLIALYQKSYLLRADLPLADNYNLSTESKDYNCQIVRKQERQNLGICRDSLIDETIKRFFSPHSETLELAVIRSEGTVIGCCLVERDIIGVNDMIVIKAPEPCYFIRFIAIHESYRGRGLMKRLLNFTDEYFLKLGARSRLCLVQSYNGASLKAFLGSGSIYVGAIRTLKLLGKNVFISYNSRVKGYVFNGNL